MSDVLINKSVQLLDEIASNPRELTLDEITALKYDIRRLHARLREWEISFDMRWRADMRAINMWHNDHPGKRLVWPDHADLVVWLLERLDDVEAILPESIDEP